MEEEEEEEWWKTRTRRRSSLLFLLLGWTVAYFCFFKSYMDIECGRQRTLQAAKSQNNPGTNQQMKIWPKKKKNFHSILILASESPPGMKDLF